MAKKPEGKDASKGTSGKPGKPGVKSDTFTQVPDDDKIKGGFDSGRLEIAGSGLRKKTYDPTDTSGCCDK